MPQVLILAAIGAGLLLVRRYLKKEQERVRAELRKAEEERAAREAEERRKKEEEERKVREAEEARLAEERRKKEEEERKVREKEERELAIRLEAEQKAREAEQARLLQHEEEIVDQRINGRLLHLSRLHGREERLAVEPSRPRHLERHLGRS